MPHIAVKIRKTYVGLLAHSKDELQLPEESSGVTFVWVVVVLYNGNDTTEEAT
jgi:hypothetical protein